MFLDFSKDANIKANIHVVNNDDNEGNRIIFIWFSEANVKNYECPFKLQFPNPIFNMIMS
jgi:hypothetical protein